MLKSWFCRSVFCLLLFHCGVGQAQSVNGLEAQVGHIWGVNSIDVNRECSSGLSVDEIDNTIRFYDLVGGGTIGRLSGSAYKANAAVYTKDGKHIAIAGDASVTLVSVPDGNIAAKYNVLRPKQGYSLLAVAFSSDEGLIAASSNTGEVIVWGATDHTVRHRFQTPARNADEVGSDTLTFVAFSPDATRLYATGGVGARIFVFDRIGAPDRYWKTEHIEVRSASLSPDGTKIAVIGRSSDRKGSLVASVWDTATGKQLAILKTDSPRGVGVRFSEDGKYIEAAAGKTIGIYNTENFRREKKYVLPANMSAVASRCGYLVSFENSGLVYEFNPAKPKNSKWLGANSDLYLPYVIKEDTSGRLLVAARKSDRFMVAKMDTETGLFEELLADSVGELGIGGFEFTPDGRILLISGDSNAHLVDVEALKLIKDMPFPGFVGNAHLFPDGKRILVSGYQSPSVIISVDTDEKTPFQVSSVSNAVFDSTGDWMAVVAPGADGNDVLSVWSTRDMGKVAETAAKGEKIAFSPDGKFVWTFNGPVYRFEIATGVMDKPFTAVGDVSGGAFSRDGSVVVVSSGKSLTTVNVANGDVIKRWDAAVDYVNELATVDNDSKIFSSDGTGAIRIWSMQDGSLLATNYLFTDGNWVIQTPEGYYKTREKFAAPFAIVQGDRVVAPGDILEAYAKPEKIGESLAKAKPLATAPAQGILIDDKPTHALIKKAQVLKAADAAAEVLLSLEAGAAVRVLDSGTAYSLVSKDGHLLGYVENEVLLKLQ